MPDGAACAGWTHKYVGDTARTMGAAVVWSAFPTTAVNDAAVFTNYANARAYLLTIHGRYLASQNGGAS